MRIDHFNIFLSNKFNLETTVCTGEKIVEGTLTDKESGKKYPILNAVPRLVDSANNYTGSFGFQWKKYKKAQLDSFTGKKLTEDRFYSNTKWNPADLKGKLVLEAGSGAGRFTEILVKSGATVISFDYSHAVEANYDNNGHADNLFLFQGNIYDISFPDNYFDFVFCYGVLQHTPEPSQAYLSIFKKLKVSGKMSIDYYFRPDHPTVWTTPKYFWRPKTVNMKPNVLLRIIKSYMIFWLPIDSWIKRLPYNIGYKILSRIPIPCYNYLDSGLTYGQRLEWAVLDTFDALSARYDYPKNKDEFERMVSLAQIGGYEIFFGSNGLVANITKS